MIGKKEVLRRFRKTTTSVETWGGRQINKMPSSVTRVTKATSNCVKQVPQTMDQRTITMLNIC